MFVDIRVFAMIAAMWLAVLANPSLAADQAPPPFKPGEKLTFNLTWGSIGAGKAVLQVRPLADLEGSAAYHFEMTARSTKTIDRIFKIRDRLESYADLEMTHSLLYKQKIREGGYRKDRVITFDWEKQELEYISNNGKPRYLPIMAGTFDPLAAFYYLRLQPLPSVKVVERPITDGKMNVIGRVKILRKENIEVRGRTYSTVVLEPFLDDVELFSSNENSHVRVWLTADHRRLPVLIESRVAFGYFRAELSRVEHVPPPERQP